MVQAGLRVYTRPELQSFNTFDTIAGIVILNGPLGPRIYHADKARKVSQTRHGKNYGWTETWNTRTPICRHCGEPARRKPINCPFPGHLESFLARTKATIAHRRQEHRNILIYYGGKCACCGFSDLDAKVQNRIFLEIDHVDGGGRQHLKRFGKTEGRQFGSFRTWLIKTKPKGFRVLCRGCNNSIEPGAEKCALHGGLQK